MGHASIEVPMRVLAWCLMPNHFHLVLWPQEDGDVSQWMHWLLNTHVRRYHQHYHSSGHIWQGRFKGFAIEEDEHLLRALRYVERNALRAGLVRRAEQWPYSSLCLLAAGEAMPPYWHEGPVRRPAKWIDWVNKPITEAELAELRTCVQRGRPYGAGPWQEAMAARLGVEASLRPRGRPRKTTDEKDVDK
jgi:putative transposase